MRDLLFLCQRLPYPPDKGDKIRSFHILRHLGKSHRIHLGCFVDDPADWRHAPKLRELCADAYFAKLDPRLARLRCSKGLLTGAPLSLPYFGDRGLMAWVRGVLARVEPEAAFIYSSAMAQYVLDGAPPPGRMVMDFVDVDSDKWRQYAETQAWPLGWMYRRESRTLLAFERRVARAADASVFVSEPEAELFRRLAPESAAKTFAVGNGIDADFFSPGADYPSPFDTSGPVLVFTGTMDYWPNVEAVTWFAREVFPAIRERFASASFFIVGARPTAEVLRLGALAGVHVTGRVADVRPYLAHAAAAVVPVRIARGLQNKILEAMAMAKPVITTPEALEGIEAAPGTEVLVAADAASFARRAVEAIENSAARELGRAARGRVVEAFAWPARLAPLDRLVTGP